MNNNNAPEINPSEMEGFDKPSGPAAFKAEQTVDENVIPINNDDSDKITKLEAALNEGHEQMLRLAADMENLRKRSVREREDASKYAVSSFARDLLAVADTFTRALQSISDELRNDERTGPLVTGIEATERSLLSCFEKHGIKKLEPMDEPFNPNFHEVMFEAPIPGKPSGIIIQLIEPGYILHDRLIRPARVGVSKSDGSDVQGQKIDTQA